MPSMIDASCPKCGKRFGWTGSMVNKPACPKCGYRDSQEDLAAADAAMKTFEELLASRPNAS
jgi:predicted nucleic-acid-binding Zn-ribbon protein